MKAVFAELPQDVQEHRRRTGADRWDEMWDGVLHMPPMPNFDHQGLAFDLAVWLRHNWSQLNQGRVWVDVNVASPGGWPNNYRVPDIVLMTRLHKRQILGSHMEGPPLVAVEIRSPSDETYEKLLFYAELGTPEVWIIHRDSREIELLILSEETYLTATPNDDGWLTSPATGVQFRTAEGRRLAVRLESRPADVTMLPEEDFDLP